MKKERERHLVRAAAATDLPLLGELEARCFQDPWPETALASELYIQPSIFLVAEATDGALEAYACFRVVADEAELLRIAVAPVRRQKGLGTKLLKLGLERCRRAGARRCYLEVREDNHEALLLYAAFGFRKAGRRAAYYQDGATALLLILDSIPEVCFFPEQTPPHQPQRPGRDVIP